MTYQLLIHVLRKDRVDLASVGASVVASRLCYPWTIVAPRFGVGVAKYQRGSNCWFSKDYQEGAIC